MTLDSPDWRRNLSGSWRRSSPSWVAGFDRARTVSDRNSLGLSCSIGLWKMLAERVTLAGGCHEPWFPG